MRRWRQLSAGVRDLPGTQAALELSACAASLAFVTRRALRCGRSADRCAPCLSPRLLVRRCPSGRLPTGDAGADSSNRTSRSRARTAQNASVHHSHQPAVVASTRNTTFTGQPLQKASIANSRRSRGGRVVGNEAERESCVYEPPSRGLNSSVTCSDLRGLGASSGLSTSSRLIAYRNWSWQALRPRYARASPGIRAPSNAAAALTPASGLLPHRELHSLTIARQTCPRPPSTFSSTPVM